MLNAIAIVVGSVVIGGSIIYADQTVQRVSLTVRGAGSFSEAIQVNLRDVQLELKNPGDLPTFPKSLDVELSNSFDFGTLTDRPFVIQSR